MKNISVIEVSMLLYLKRNFPLIVINLNLLKVYYTKEDIMEEKIFLARVAEQAERFEDMVKFLDEAIALKNGEDFTNDERNLLSVGFKNLIGSTRGAIRTIGAIE